MVLRLHSLCISSGGDVNIINTISGLSLLHEAVGSIEGSSFKTFRSVLRVLLKAGCDMNAEGSALGDTPLLRAILANKFRFAEELIREGCDVNRGNVYTCDIDNLWLAKHLKELRLVKMIVYAGYNLRRIVEPQDSGDVQPRGGAEPSIREWLAAIKRSPLRLCDLCRIQMRQQLGQNLLSKVKQLSLPSTLQDFLLLSDLRDIYDRDFFNGLS